jgi:predicted Zn-dependent protease
MVDTTTINAWAMPGGRLVVTTGMMAFLQSEAELAAVLGHEIAHVDARHCIDRYEYQLALGRAGLGGAGALVDMARHMATAGYSKYQEAEADALGMRLMIDAGYDPHAAVEVMERFATQQGRDEAPRPSSVVSELGQVVAGGLGDYLASHPETRQRAHRLEARLHAERRRVAGHSFYVGVDNYTRRVPRDRDRKGTEVRTY